MGKKFLIFPFLAVAQVALAASIQYVTIGVNGFTCSMCSRNVEMSIRKLDFVDSVVMDIDKTEGRVYAKSGANYDLARIARAVTDAGYSVRSMRIAIDLNGSSITTQGCFSIGQYNFQWIGMPAALPKGSTELIVIGDKFMPRKEFQSWQKKITQGCSDKSVNYVTAE